MKVKLTEKAQQEQQLFDDVFLPRSRQKWEQGVRTNKRFTPPKEWEWYVQQYGPNLLVSLYVSHRYCVVTTPNGQFGMLSDELPEWIHADLKQTPRTPFLAECRPDEGGKLTAVTTPEQLVGLKGEVFANAEGQIGFAIPPAGVPGAVQFEVLDAHGDGGHAGMPFPGMPAWADVQVGDRKVRINPEIIQPPFMRLADCLWFAFKSWNIFTPEKDCFNKLAFPPAPHPNSQDFAFRRCVLPCGTEVVQIDTWERLERLAKRHHSHDGQHRTSISGMERWKNHDK
jgi:hypothetical protein